MDILKETEGTRVGGGGGSKGNLKCSQLCSYRGFQQSSQVDNTLESSDGRDVPKEQVLVFVFPHQTKEHIETLDHLILVVNVPAFTLQIIVYYMHRCMLYSFPLKEGKVWV